MPSNRRWTSTGSSSSTRFAIIVTGKLTMDVPGQFSAGVRPNSSSTVTQSSISFCATGVAERDSHRLQLRRLVRRDPAILEDRREDVELLLD